MDVSRHCTSTFGQPSWPAVAIARLIAKILRWSAVCFGLLALTAFSSQSQIHGPNHPLNWRSHLILESPLGSSARSDAEAISDVAHFDVFQVYLIRELARLSRMTCQYDWRTLIDSHDRLVSLLSPSSVTIGSVAPASAVECISILSSLTSAHPSSSDIEQSKRVAMASIHFVRRNDAIVGFQRLEVDNYILSKFEKLSLLRAAHAVSESAIASISTSTFQQWKAKFGNINLNFRLQAGPSSRPRADEQGGACVESSRQQTLAPGQPSTSDRANSRCLTVISVSSFEEIESAYEDFCGRIASASARVEQDAICIKLQPVLSHYWLVIQEVRRDRSPNVNCLSASVLLESTKYNWCPSNAKLHRID